MLDGLYKVKFSHDSKDGHCICLFHEGRIAGGGAVMYYLGEYNLRGHRFTGEITAKRHASRGIASPIHGLDQFSMRIDGLFSGGYGQVIGKIADAPDVMLMASLNKLGDL